jgi:hypothetical protein
MSAHTDAWRERVYMARSYRTIWRQYRFSGRLCRVSNPSGSMICVYVLIRVGRTPGNVENNFTSPVRDFTLRFPAHMVSLNVPQRLEMHFGNLNQRSRPMLAYRNPRESEPWSGRANSCRFWTSSTVFERYSTLTTGKIVGKAGSICRGRHGGGGLRESMGRQLITFAYSVA